jgi:hypothetical protein
MTLGLCITGFARGSLAKRAGHRLAATPTFPDIVRSHQSNNHLAETAVGYGYLLSGGLASNSELTIP